MRERRAAVSGRVLFQKIKLIGLIALREGAVFSVNTNRRDLILGLIDSR